MRARGFQAERPHSGPCEDKNGGRPNRRGKRDWGWASRSKLTRLSFLIVAYIASSFALNGCASPQRKPWHSPEKEANKILERALDKEKKVALAVLGRATAEMTRKELDSFGVSKQSWEQARSSEESALIAESFQRQFGERINFGVLKPQELDQIELGRKYDDPGRPLEQEAVEIANFAHATHLAYWTLHRIPYGQYHILDKLTLKLIEIPSGRTLSIEAFQEVKK